MLLPEVNAIEKSRNMVNTFMGYFHNDTVNEYADSQFSEMKNMSSDAFPSLEPRKGRLYIKKLEKPNGLFAFEKLVYVDGTSLFYDGEKVLDVSDTEKEIVGMGANIVVFPDKVIYNTETGESDSLEFLYTTENDIVFSMCRGNGDEYLYYTGPNEPDITEYIYWLDTSSAPQVFKMWSENQASWTEVSSTYVKILETPDVYVEGIKVYVSVIEPDISEVSQGDYWLDMSDDTLYVLHREDGAAKWIEEQKEYEVRHKNWGERVREYDSLNISGCYNEDMNASMIVQAAGKDYIIVTAVIEGLHVQGAADKITLERKVPDMDYICEQDNRIWGCSSKNHEIYACKLGDPRNWYCYAGLSSDSYAATIGSHGKFTGCISHMGYVLFFKENCIHKVYGTAPANFTINALPCHGVQEGSEKSLCIINEILYYQSRDGICVYDGNIPEIISNDLGDEVYKGGIGGRAKEKYYIRTKDSHLNSHIFVYDTKKVMWHREDELPVKQFANMENKLYCLTEDGELWAMDENDIYTNILPGIQYEYGGVKEILCPSDVLPGKEMSKEKELVEWEAVTNILGMDIPDNKYISNITLRIAVSEKAEFCVYMEYDSSGEWEKVLHMRETRKRSYTIPVRIRRCDHFRIRFSGKGICRLFSYTKTIENGSEW